MKPELEELKEIESYLAGALPEERRLAFESRIRSELGIKGNIELTKRVIDAIKGYGFKLMIRRIREEEFGPHNQSPLSPAKSD